MLNFRKLRQDYSSNILKEGKTLHDKGAVQSAKIAEINPQSLRLTCQVTGNFENTYTCDLEIDRRASTTIDSDCNCPSTHECQHLASCLYHLEEHLDKILVAYKKEGDVQDKAIEATIQEAENKEMIRMGAAQKKELVQEYVQAASFLGKSPFFLPEETAQEVQAEIFLIFQMHHPKDLKSTVEIQIAIRPAFRSKPFAVLDIKQFLDGVRFGEVLYLFGKRFIFSLDSFEAKSALILKKLLESARFHENRDEKSSRFAYISSDCFGTLLAEVYAQTIDRSKFSLEETEKPILSCFYINSLEEPLRLSLAPPVLRFVLECVEVSFPKILIHPQIVIDDSTVKELEEVNLFECATPGIISGNIYYRFSEKLQRRHLKSLSQIRNLTIPDPLFGTFIENALPTLMQYGEVVSRDLLDRFVTLPYTENLKAKCSVVYLNGELEAKVIFLYGTIEVPAALQETTMEHINPFVTKTGILARNLTEEQKILEELFQDFTYNQAEGTYTTKNDKKIVEFMTDTVPKNQHYIHFDCPENLLERFLYDDTLFTLELSEMPRIDRYALNLKVNGYLQGVSIEALWDCVSSRRGFIEIQPKKGTKKKTTLSGEEGCKNGKILCFDLDKISAVIRLFDEMGIENLINHQLECPLWSLSNIQPKQFEHLPVTFSMTDKLIEIQKQMLGLIPIEAEVIPTDVKATFRSYQIEGINWLSRLRRMHLNGILADDMGLGKTLQAIVSITQLKKTHPKSISMIVCPTSLVYNWKEEFYKFNPLLTTLAVDGTPLQRKRLLEEASSFDIVITSYSLLQKDIEIYKKIPFTYIILDEAQHIKNRSTRNAKSVKALQATHRLILTGTPIENSLDELWSLFDFLMPGLVGSFERFVEKYVRESAQKEDNLEQLKKKVSPFILRRMKKDVLQDLPPVSEIVYHCHLSAVQKELYQSYAKSAREELSRLVKKEGFDRVQIHVLATLTRLKQICCHPAIFAKEKAEPGDSAKYDMLIELLQNLIAGKHKTVIFSQYTKMLNLLREELKKQGICFEYLDGTSKNRMSIVKKFNEDLNIPIFLVSLKAGGAGLNLVGADTVIHYDMWWNPAVENQATDRVHRLGQKQSVSSYKLVTLNTIEEKIVELQNRKKGLVNIVSCDEEALGKLTWEEVLELLQT